MSKEYIALRRLGERRGSRQWRPGDRITLDDDQAARLVRLGYIQPAPELLAEPAPKKTRKPKEEAPPVAPITEELAAPDPAPIVEEHDNGTVDSTAIDI